MTKLSHSAVSLYLTCARKYFYHYKKKLRSKVISAALLSGGAIDKGINVLLETRDLKQALAMFDKSFSFNFINGKGFSVPKSELVVYAKRDFDIDLLESEDQDKIDEMFKEENGPDSYDFESFFKSILAAKEEKGFENLTKFQKQFYNYANWLSMRRKAHIMIKGYHDQVLPKIKKVLASQKKITLKNSEGDEIIGYIDLEAEWEDGKKYVLDNKTSSIEYDPDSAMTSQQLVLYYHAEKAAMKLDGAGFIVMMKNINKNKVKICSECGNDGSGARHKTCAAEIKIIGIVKEMLDPVPKVATRRCNGTWIETIKPEARIDIILNKIPEAAENLIIETFDEANEGIKKEAFGPNLESCMKYGMPCAYYNLCWKNDKSDLVEMEKEK